MFFPDFDSEWDDDLPTVLQVLEGIEVEELPDIHVERETPIYPTISEMAGANRLAGLKLILESAEKTTAEIQSAEHKSAGIRVGEYKPLMSSNTIPQNTTETYSPSLSTSFLFKSGIGPTTGTKPGVVGGDTRLVEFSGEVQVGVATEDIAVFTGIPESPRGGGMIIDKDPRGTNKKILRGDSGNYQWITAGEEDVSTRAEVVRSADKVPEVGEVADSTDEAQGGITRGICMSSLL